jgi:hypothetical protein
VGTAPGDYRLPGGATGPGLSKSVEEGIRAAIDAGREKRLPLNAPLTMQLTDDEKSAERNVDRARDVVVDTKASLVESEAKMTAAIEKLKALENEDGA